jgi:excisionase family DNA binding protein
VTRSTRQVLPKEWLSVHEACELLGVVPATLRRWSTAGRVPSFTTPGGHRRFSRLEILSLLPSQNSGEMCKSVGDILEFRNRYLNELAISSNRLELSREETEFARDLAIQVIDNLIVDFVSQFET